MNVKCDGSRPYPPLNADETTLMPSSSDAASLQQITCDKTYGCCGSSANAPTPNWIEQPQMCMTQRDGCDVASEQHATPPGQGTPEPIAPEGNSNRDVSLGCGVWA